VGAGAGRLRRAAASTAHGRHAAGVLCHGWCVCERRAGERRGAELGRGEVGWRGRRAAAGGFAGALGRLRQAGQKRGGGPIRREKPFSYIFSMNFYMLSFNYYFEQENDLF